MPQDCQADVGPKVRLLIGYWSPYCHHSAVIGNGQKHLCMTPAGHVRLVKSGNPYHHYRSET
jgi:hypothetical protein